MYSVRETPASSCVSTTAIWPSCCSWMTGVNRASFDEASVPASAFVLSSTALLLTMKSWQSRESTRSLAFHACRPASSRNGDTNVYLLRTVSPKCGLIVSPGMYGMDDAPVILPTALVVRGASPAPLPVSAIGASASSLGTGGSSCSSSLIGWGSGITRVSSGLSTPATAAIGAMTRVSSGSSACAGPPTGARCRRRPRASTICSSSCERTTHNVAMYAMRISTPSTTAASTLRSHAAMPD